MINTTQSKAWCFYWSQDPSLSTKELEEMKLNRQVCRNNRSKITFTLHPDIVKVIKNTAAEEKLPLSIIADESLYAGLKVLGRIS